MVEVTKEQGHGACLPAPGSIRSAHEAPAGLRPTGDDPSRDEFCARFKARMLKMAGPAFAGGESIADYADEAGPTYFEDAWARSEGPEAAADVDMSYWGDS